MKKFSPLSLLLTVLLASCGGGGGDGATGTPATPPGSAGGSTTPTSTNNNFAGYYKITFTTGANIYGVCASVQITITGRLAGDCVIYKLNGVQQISSISGQVAADNTISALMTNGGVVRGVINYPGYKGNGTFTEGANQGNWIIERVA